MVLAAATYIWYCFVVIDIGWLLSVEKNNEKRERFVKSCLENLKSSTKCLKLGQNCVLQLDKTLAPKNKTKTKPWNFIRQAWLEHD